MTRRYVSDVQRVRGLGFCVSVAHAEFMADSLYPRVSSACVTGRAPDAIRKSATGQLAAGRVRFILRWMCTMRGWMCQPSTRCCFCADGKPDDFPSAAGPGPAPRRGKDCLTVLDFIGQSQPALPAHRPSLRRCWTVRLTVSEPEVGAALSRCCPRDVLWH